MKHGLVTDEYNPCFICVSSVATHLQDIVVDHFLRVALGTGIKAEHS